MMSFEANTADYESDRRSPSGWRGMSGVVHVVESWLLELAKVIWPFVSTRIRRRVILQMATAGISVLARGRQLGDVPSGEDGTWDFAVTAALLKAKRLPRADLILQLARDQVLTKQLTFPDAVHDVLDPVVRNQLQSLVPWPVDMTCFGYRIVDRSGGKIRVALAAVHKDQIDTFQREAAAAHISFSRIEVHDAGESSSSIVLLDADVRKRRALARAIGRALAVLCMAALLSGGIGGYLWLQKTRTEAALADTIRHVRSELMAHAGGRFEQTKAVRQLNALVGLKSRDAMTLALIDALSEAVPDQAYLESLSIRNGLLTIAGKADDAAALISALERSGRFQFVRFGGPTVREQRSGKEAFTIEAKIPVRSAMHDQVTGGRR